VLPPIVEGAPLQPAAASEHPQRLRVVSWNMKAGRGSSLSAIAQRLASLAPDVVALQEVDVDTRRTGRVDQPVTLAAALGFHHAFAEAIPWSGGRYGIATLSRYPFQSLRRIPLSNTAAGEARTALDAEICAAGSCMHILNHHADVRPLAAEQSTREILAHVAGQPGQRTIFLGDLNQTPDAPGPTACVAAGLTDVGARLDPQPTQGDRRIDYAYVDLALASCIAGFHVEPASESDHAALVLDLDLGCLSR